MHHKMGYIPLALALSACSRRLLLQATHEDAMTELRAELQKAQDVLGEVQTALSAAGDTSAAQAVQLEEAQAATAELQGQLGA
jgi:chromosome condensin MukBEF complex kleisin-like MukF subunit